MFGLFRKKQTALEPTADQIVPRIKHLNFLKTVKEITAKQPEATPLTRPLVADLLVTYAFDLPAAFLMVREMDRQRLDLSLDQIHSTALANLQKQLPLVRQGGKAPLVRLSVGNNLDACLLLIDEIWQKASAIVPGTLVVSVPSRDIVLLTSSESEQGLNAMRQISKETREREPVHGLSEQLLTWANGKWSVFPGIPAAT